jgi:hypothetical protein
VVPPWLEVGRKCNDRVVGGLWVVAGLILILFFSLVVVLVVAVWEELPWVVPAKRKQEDFKTNLFFAIRFYEMYCYSIFFPDVFEHSNKNTLLVHIHSW